jgi:Phosphate starvation-inducible protein PhoH, predicted ATPase
MCYNKIQNMHGLRFLAAAGALLLRQKALFCGLCRRVRQMHKHVAPVQLQLQLRQEESFSFMTEHTINIDRMEHAAALFGSFDENIELIRQQLKVDVLCRGSEIKVSGDAENVLAAAKTIQGLLTLVERGELLNSQKVRYMMTLVEEGSEDTIQTLAQDVICVTAKGKPLKAKTLGQKRYVDAMRNHTITLGVGPAGTGKTYLAVAMAARAFRSHDVNRIILTRPAVEAGEKLGFLPGDLQHKVDPYLRPLYDALFDMFGVENYNKYIERGNIEIAPLAYMRGRTLDDSFIILDEAQNTTHEQMKMFLTRLGAGSKAVITGDITQIDLPDPKASGLIQATKVLRHVEDISIVRFSDKDVVRHKLVQDIVKAYEKYYEDSRKGK